MLTRFRDCRSFLLTCIFLFVGYKGCDKLILHGLSGLVMHPYVVPVGKGLWIASIYGFIISVPCFMCFLLHYWFN